jgi:hypothetical protein
MGLSEGLGYAGPTPGFFGQGIRKWPNLPFLIISFWFMSIVNG